MGDAPRTFSELSPRDRTKAIVLNLIGWPLILLEILGLYVAFFRKGFATGVVALVLPPYAWILAVWQIWVWATGVKLKP